MWNLLTRLVRCVREGLREGDRIIEVNGVNVERDFHAECAAKIHSVVGQVKLLVVDSEADAYFQQRRMPLSSSQPYVSKHACPIKNPPGPASCQIFFYSFMYYRFTISVRLPSIFDSGLLGRRR